ncbi:MAG TPA: alpha/beta fold hydrolase [Pseudonocardiaceae bacterium]|nr:alpha/beta fold hydrolase [Pseudonocardiaceae bacterium]
MTRSSWVQVGSPRSAARLRLICLPPAGGGASRYRDWAAYFPEDIEVVAVQLPGREGRFVEEPLTSMEQVASPLLEGLASYITHPCALFGHSMGALIAFELARRMQSAGLAPVHLFASGCRAPHLPSRSPDWHTLPDPEFITVIKGLGGIPPELLAEPEFLEAMLPTLRCDCQLVETYTPSPGPPLRCPVTAFGGLRDAEVFPEDVRAWSTHTTGPFQAHFLPGDHFFINSARPELLRLLGSALTATIARVGH